MKQYEAIYQDDELTARMYDSAMGGVDLRIYLHRQGRGPELVHMGNFNSYKEAENEMREVFPGIEWR